MITRFAPSLTGYLHLGHVLHMMYVWGIARQKGAQVLCRIEDHDRGRVRPEFEQSILDDMQWLGFNPDSGMSAETAAGRSAYRQSDCSDHYESVLQDLRRRGLVYGCACSRKQIMKTQEDGHGELCYAGTCSEKGLPLEGNTVRFRIPDDHVEFEDLRLGTCHQAPVGQCGDFSLRNRHGEWTYQFACVCDDIRHGVDLVIRGEDILPSTGRQILLFKALNATAPEYYHHPLIHDEHGGKLSKRQRSESILQMRDSGVTAEDIIGQAAEAGGLLDSFRPLQQGDAISLVTNRVTIVS